MIGHDLVQSILVVSLLVVTTNLDASTGSTKISPKLFLPFHLTATLTPHHTFITTHAKQIHDEKRLYDLYNGLIQMQPKLLFYSKTDAFSLSFMVDDLFFLLLAYHRLLIDSYL